MTKTTAPVRVAEGFDQPRRHKIAGFGSDFRSKYTEPLFIVVLAVKLLVSPFIASWYLRDLFGPFINAYIALGLANPWEFFNENGLNLRAFPYHPVMLWVFAAPRLVFSFLFDNMAWEKVTFSTLAVMRMPLIGADILIYSVLASWFATRIRRVLIVYWCSPIIFYVSYYHGQLDLVPTALLMLALYFLFQRRYVAFGVTLAVGIATKSHLLVAVPFLAIYLARTSSKASIVRALAAMLLTFGATVVAALPYLASSGYRRMVLQAPEQLRVFELGYAISTDQVRVLFAPAAVLAILLRFAHYKKLNQDITVLYLGLASCTLVLLVPPMPGWYLWMLPFLAYYLISKPTSPMFGLTTFHVSFLGYFLVWPHSDLWDAWRLVSTRLASLPTPYDWLQSHGVNAALVSDITFTAMQVSLLTLLFWMYRAGVRSNELYRPRTKPMMIGISGDSASGKDTVGRLLASLLGKERVIQISGDDYHRWPRGHQQWTVYTHLNAETSNLHDQLRNAIALCNGQPVQKVHYDHKLGTFTAPAPVEPNEYIVSAGLHTFYLEKMRSMFDLKIFLDPDEMLRLNWKINRDRLERGYTTKQVVDQINTRRADAAKFIRPQSEFVDVIISLRPSVPVIDPEATSDDQPLETEFLIKNSFDIASLVEALRTSGGIRIECAHSGDLRYQRVCADGRIGAGTVRAIAAEAIPNIEELVGESPNWSDNHNGLIQVFLLACLSNILQWRESSRHNIEADAEARV